jgi:hypothetical protein
VNDVFSLHYISHVLLSDHEDADREDLEEEDEHEQDEGHSRPGRMSADANYRRHPDGRGDQGHQGVKAFRVANLKGGSYGDRYDDGPHGRGGYGNGREHEPTPVRTYAQAAFKLTRF